jgi:hypothetical protein
LGSDIVHRLWLIAARAQCVCIPFVGVHAMAAVVFAVLVWCVVISSAASSLAVAHAVVKGVVGGRGVRCAARVGSSVAAGSINPYFSRGVCRLKRVFPMRLVETLLAPSRTSPRAVDAVVASAASTFLVTVVFIHGLCSHLFLCSFFK